MRQVWERYRGVLHAPRDADEHLSQVGKIRQWRASLTLASEAAHAIAKTHVVELDAEES